MGATDDGGSVAVSDLGTIGSLISEDERAVVWDLPTFDLPDVAGALAYRAHRPGHHPASTPDAVALRARLSPALRARLDELADWPVRAVHDDGTPAGVVIARPPARHRGPMRPPSGERRIVDRELGRLCVPDATARWLDLPRPDEGERIGICRALAEALRFLHELGATVPHLRGEGVTFHMGRVPQVRFRGPDPLVGSRDRAQDLHALGLLVLRSLTPGPGRSVARDPAGAAGVLDRAGMELLTRALEGPENARPSADEWARVLARQPGQPLRAPVLDAAECERTLVPAGEPVVVRWVGSGVDSIEVAGHACPPVGLQVTGGSGAVTVHPTGTGRVVVTATNAGGTTELSIGPIAVLDVPRMGTIPVPAPDIRWPSLDHNPLPDVARLLPSLPASASVNLPEATNPVDLLSAAPVPAPPVLFPTVPPPPGFDTGATAFPVDITGILTGAPDLPPVRPRRRRLFRRRVTT